MAIPPQEIEKNEKLLALFWVHSYRLSQHSLWSEPKLRSWESKEIKVTLSTDNSTTISMELPDRERFESLVARLRPFILTGESIYLFKIFKSLATLIHANSSTLTNEENSFISRMKSLLNEMLVNSGSPLAFSAFQRSMSNPDLPVVSASDKEMAHAFLYGSLIHVDVDQKYEQSMKFDDTSRFEAAVPFYFRIGRIILAVRDLVMALRDSNRISVSATARMDQLLENEGTRGSNELKAELWVHSEDLPLPLDLESIGALEDLKSAGWEQLGLNSETVLELGSPDDSELVLWDSEKKRLGTWPCKKIEKGSSPSENLPTYLIGDFMELVFTQESQISFHTLIDSNQKALSWLDFSLNHDQATSLSIGDRVLGFSKPEDSKEISRKNKIKEFLGDIVALEKLLGQELPLIEGEYGDAHRLIMRTLRLLFEGEIVPDWSVSRTVSANFLQGKGPGEKIHMASFKTPPTEVKIANITIHIPETTIAATAWEIEQSTDNSSTDEFLIFGADGEKPMRWLGIEPRDTRKVASPTITPFV